MLVFHLIGRKYTKCRGDQLNRADRRARSEDYAPLLCAALTGCCIRVGMKLRVGVSVATQAAAACIG